ncbi:MAG: hypothetical protein KKC85_22015 [Gammaproteobacteria bacterium]|nr:hypothetical protein [Gammaproteobacteria bacterium]MBU1441243.1 hypothetical protein [Gammaproteobacteria bacterium]MBU2289082.1 hypothetical protein [Gammaproteobacteria bacterium]
MNRLTQSLQRACDLLGLEIEIGSEIGLASGRFVYPLARILRLGAPNGMLVFRRYADFAPFAEELVSKRYAYSTLDEPLDGETFDPESFVEMFQDWGWSGDEDHRPSWMQKNIG